MAFVKALAKSEVQPGGARCVELQGKRIAIFNVNGTFRAIDDTCTHDEASLAEGTVYEDEKGRCIVACPWHGANFDLCTGTALTLPAVTPVKAYVVREVGDAIEIDI